MADHKARIDELQKEGTGLIAKRDEAAAFIQKVNVRLSEISGALKELDLLSKKEAPKKEAPKK